MQKDQNEIHFATLKHSRNGTAYPLISCHHHPFIQHFLLCKAFQHLSHCRSPHRRPLINNLCSLQNPIFKLWKQFKTTQVELVNTPTIKTLPTQNCISTLFKLRARDSNLGKTKAGVRCGFLIFTPCISRRKKKISSSPWFQPLHSSNFLHVENKLVGWLICHPLQEFILFIYLLINKRWFPIQGVLLSVIPILLLL